MSIPITSEETKRRQILLAEETELVAPVIARLNDYLARTGLAIPEFARRVGYGDATIRFFLRGSYHNISRSARGLVKTIEGFIDSHPIGETARVLGDLYDTANVRIIRDTFQKLLPKPVAYMIYAPPGSQKSFVLEHQVAELNRSEIAKESGQRAFYIYARQNLRPRDLVRRVAIACGCRVSNDLDPMLASIRFEFRHNRVLLTVDEAQHLSIECFETLRELLDQPPYFSLLFTGSHDLKRKFDEFSATLEQWNSRIIAKVRLPGLERAEAVGIIEREIGELLGARDAGDQRRLIDSLITGATVRDAFENNRSYINVRTLTNALDQIRSAAGQPHATEVQE